MPKIGKPVEVHATFRFTVTIGNLDQAAFTECTLPSLQVETIDINEGGLESIVHRLPVRVKASTVTLRRGIVKSSELWAWYDQVRRGDISKALREVTITMFGLSHGSASSSIIPISTWVFHRAYPIKWVGPQLKAGDQAIALEEIEIAHHGFEVK